MSRTNIDLDDAACDAVMERFNLRSKRDAVNLALRRLAAEPPPADESARGARVCRAQEDRAHFLPCVPASLFATRLSPWLRDLNSARCLRAAACQMTAK
jgi:Arc/MetJ family transcription regulator